MAKNRNILTRLFGRQEEATKKETSERDPTEFIPESSDMGFRSATGSKVQEDNNVEAGNNVEASSKGKTSSKVVKDVYGHQIVLAEVHNDAEALKTIAKAVKEGRDCICHTADGRVLYDGNSNEMHSARVGINTKAIDVKNGLDSSRVYVIPEKAAGELLQRYTDACITQYEHEQGRIVRRGGLEFNAPREMTLQQASELHSAMGRFNGHAIACRTVGDGVEVVYDRNEFSDKLYAQYEDKLRSSPSPDKIVMRFESQEDAVQFLNDAQSQALAVCKDERGRFTEYGGIMTMRIDNKPISEAAHDFSVACFGKAISDKVVTTSAREAVCVSEIDGKTHITLEPRSYMNAYFMAKYSNKIEEYSMANSEVKRVSFVFDDKKEAEVFVQEADQLSRSFNRIDLTDFLPDHQIERHEINTPQIEQMLNGATIQAHGAMDVIFPGEGCDISDQGNMLRWMGILGKENVAILTQEGDRVSVSVYADSAAGVHAVQTLGDHITGSDGSYSVMRMSFDSREQAIAAINELSSYMDKNIDKPQIHESPVLDSQEHAGLKSNISIIQHAGITTLKAHELPYQEAVQAVGSVGAQYKNAVVLKNMDEGNGRIHIMVDARYALGQKLLETHADQVTGSISPDVATFSMGSKEEALAFLEDANKIGTELNKGIDLDDREFSD